MFFDFTIQSYKKLLVALKDKNYNFLSFEQFLTNQSAINNQSSKILIHRHDVDLQPARSFETASMEHALGISGTYYFRIVKQSFQPQIIEQIAALGHEIGYHYEDVALAKGNLDQAIESFEQNLAIFRKYYPVRTICMHGSPLSKWDNRLLWQKYDYRALGVIGEPYLDVDFSKVFYLTDTGRRWDGDKVSVRDKVTAENQTLNEKLGLKLHSTFDIIKALEQGLLPDQIMLTIHPQRWHDNYFLWTRELLSQSAKNPVKRMITHRNLFLPAGRG